MNQNEQKVAIDESKLLEELNKVESSISNAEKAKIQAETKKEGYRTQYAELNEELKALGIEPKEAKQKYIELGQECLKEMEDLKSLIPEGF